MALATSITAMPAAVWRRLDKELWVKRLLIVLACLWLLVVVVLPLGQLLSKSMTDRDGQFDSAFLNSIRMSFYSALFGTLITFTTAYLIEKSRQMALLRQTAYFLSLLLLALPGLVIGLAYIFFFNAPGWTIGGRFIANPLGFIYATMAILVISNIVHFYSVAFLTATTALKQLDREFEMVSESMGVSFARTFTRVTVPICVPAILEIGMFYFVNAMATVSAVIFLYSADLPLASVAVANMDDAGDIAPACAMSILIVLTNLCVRIGYTTLTRGIKKRSQAWALR
jgi:iron(III) transport system permease protein